MKVLLLHRDRDFDVKPQLRDEMFAAMTSGNLFAINNVSERERARNAASAARQRRRPGPGPRARHALDAMAPGDAFLFAMAKRASSPSLCDPEAIVYRQAVLRTA